MQTGFEIKFKRKYKKLTKFYSLAMKKLLDRY